MGCVYIITNDVNERVYIGSTNRPIETRLREHKSRSQKGSKKHFELYKEMREIGVNHFHISVLKEDIPEENLLNAEQECIKNFPRQDLLLNTKSGLSETDIAYILSAYQSGKRVKEIARERGHCSKTVSLVLKEHNVKILDWNDAERVKISEEELRRLYEVEFKTTPEIAAIYGTSHQTILKWLRRYQIPVRKALNRKYL